MRLLKTERFLATAATAVLARYVYDVVPIRRRTDNWLKRLPSASYVAHQISLPSGVVDMGNKHVLF